MPAGPILVTSGYSFTFAIVIAHLSSTPYWNWAPNLLASGSGQLAGSRSFTG